jgi:putative acetyltransferase
MPTHIRPFHHNDANIYHTIANDPVTLATYLGTPATEIGTAIEWAKSQRAGLHRLAIEHDGTPVGFGMLEQSQRPRLIHSGILEWLLHPDYRNSELSEQLLTALLDLADNWLNLRRVEVQLIVGDEAGRQLVERLGFEQEGIQRQAIFSNGRFRDVVVFGRVRDYIPPPSIVLPRLERSRSQLAAVTIRAMRPEDAADLHDFYRDPVVVRTLNQLPSQEYSATAERAAKYGPNLYRLVAEVDGRVVGNIVVGRSDNPRMSHSGRLGMAVHRDYWGQGVGSCLMQAMINLADNWLNMRRIELGVHPDNAAAIHLYEKFGFEMEGRQRLYNYGDGRWADAYFMARLRPL